MGPANMVRLYAAFVLLVALMVAVAVLGGQGGTLSSGEPLPPSLVVDRIAYVGLDRQIRTVNPDGSDETRVTPGEGRFTWPAWSPDGRKMVFTGVTDTGQGLSLVGVYLFNTYNGETRQLHVGLQRASIPVAYNTPHYFSWSPDGSRLAFIGPTTHGLALYLEDLRDHEEPRIALERAPMWLDWSPDSRYLLVHRGEDHKRLDTEEGVTTDLDIPSGGLGYHVPAWRPSGEAITYISGDASEGYALYTSGLDAADARLVDEVPRNTAFLWSPDGELLAVTSGRPRTASFGPGALNVYEGIGLYSSDGSRLETEVRDSVVAFFWSPDSSKLAYVTLRAQVADMMVLHWNILDVVEGKRWSLTDFLPSLDQLTVLESFDQYAHSHSLWSPDSTSLVFAGRVASRAVTASLDQQETSQIIVIATHRYLEFHVLDDGYLGFWSPR